MMNRGYDVELLFEQRLRQLGYEGACRPAREDCGVDYVLFTEKGWIGIQVKSAKENNRKSVKRGTVPSGQLRTNIGSGHRGKTLEHYKACGVSVFALHDRGVFYLVPISGTSSKGVYCNVNSPFREAWHEVLGAPILKESVREQEIEELETLYDRQ